VDEFFENHIEFMTMSNHDWNQIEDFTPGSTFEVFLFRNYSFYFNMLKNIIDNLIPTGIMKYLVENFYTKKHRFETPAAGPQVLTFNDLLFGFKIWIGSFLLALLAFLGENFERLKKRNRKIKLLKVHPLKGSSERSSTKLTANLIKIFRKGPNLKIDDEQSVDCNCKADFSCETELTDS
jgi:hypothetical protein